MLNLHIDFAGKIAHTNYSIPNWDRARELGYTINEGVPDVIIGMSISCMDRTIKMARKFPNAKLFCYNWDCYDWVLNNPRPKEKNYKKYRELLSQATEIWVPSRCTGIKLTKWWGFENWQTVVSAVPYWDYPDVKDNGYALCCLREIPDVAWGMFERACDELGIPWKATSHQCTYREYQEAVAHCSFLVSPLYELSTGGLSIMEGYYLGKPCLLSDSPWHGGIDYMLDRATYFKHDDYEDFKNKLFQMFNNQKLLNRSNCKNYITNNFTDSHMVENMLSKIRKYCD